MLGSLHIDRKFIQLLGNRLEGFTRKSSKVYNFRCPFCLDSKVNRRKKRGYFLAKNNHFIFYCHNCGFSTNVRNVLKRLDLRLYNEYNLELLQDKGDIKEIVTRSNTAVRFDHGPYGEALKKLPKISQLSHDHPAKVYVDSRQIPTPFHSVLRWCENFNHWTNQLVPGKFSNDALMIDEGRILIPLFSKENQFFAYTGRSIIPESSLRYIEIVLNQDIPLVFGMNAFHPEKQGYVFEGAIDAMFIPNSLAMMGSNLNALTFLKDYDNLIICFDNEPRSNETKNKINQAIILGYRVCIWPRWVVDKDINDMVRKSNLTWQRITEIIEANSFKGLEATLQLKQWSRR